MLDQLEEILSQKDLAAAEREIERASPGDVVEQPLQLVRGELRPVLDHPVAVNAPLVAPHGEIDMDGQRDVERHALVKQPLGEIRHGRPEASGSLR